MLNENITGLNIVSQLRDIVGVEAEGGELLELLLKSVIDDADFGPSLRF